MTSQGSIMVGMVSKGMELPQPQRSILPPLPPDSSRLLASWVALRKMALTRAGSICWSWATSDCCCSADRLAAYWSTWPCWWSVNSCWMAVNDSVVLGIMRGGGTGGGWSGRRERGEREQASEGRTLQVDSEILKVVQKKSEWNDGTHHWSFLSRHCCKRGPLTPVTAVRHCQSLA